ncbi:glucose-6-phosphate isomerase [Deferrisoma camini]|uniref:glucose-6-phosphate isomerase n=1 Tax=Deferrisoma camini TaxID=1035120 RepID=UPI00046D8774|nr:glucose-6-phosphate isomerase [Deferrisoma camini]
MSESSVQTVTLHYANALADRVGPAGLTPADLEAQAGAVARVHRDINERRTAGDLGFYELPHRTDGLEASQAMARQVGESCENLLVLGIGGSALGTLAVHRALCPALHNLWPRRRRGGMRLFVCDNVDPETIAELLEWLDPNETAVNVISKSGGTAETLAQFLRVYGWLRDALGPDAARRRVVVTTDPDKGFLRRLARQEGLPALDVPPNVGGRFSVLTPVGLFPLACAGVDVEGLLAGAAHMESHVSRPDLWENPAYLFGLIHVLFYRRGRNVNVMMPYSDALRDVADWFRQLWAESLGKRYALDGGEVFVGPTPVKALGTTDQHSQVQLYMEGPPDKVITFLEVAHPRREVRCPPLFPEAEEAAYLGGKTLGELLGAEKRATEAALTENGRPNLTLALDRVDAHQVGQVLFLLEAATVFAGGLLGINPLDQPGVELGKRLTFALMGRPGYGDLAGRVGELSDPDPRWRCPRP